MLFRRNRIDYGALVAFEEGLTGNKVVGYTNEVKECLPRILSEKHMSEQGDCRWTLSQLGLENDTGYVRRCTAVTPNWATRSTAKRVGCV